jgi:ParB family chromosome partitioning protein
MARTSKMARAGTVAMVAEAAADADVRSVGETEAVAAVETGAETVSVAANGETVFIPLNKLKKHPKNARKTPHSEASIEAKAASIAAKGILQNLVVEPETTRRRADRLLSRQHRGRPQAGADAAREAQADQEDRTHPLRHRHGERRGEISLDENVTREDLHPADQFERFRELSEHRGWGAEEIAARFGVTAHVVKQRLRLGAVSPKLMQVYRDGGLTLGPVDGLRHHRGSRAAGAGL